MMGDQENQRAYERHLRQGMTEFDEQFSIISPEDQARCCHEWLSIMDIPEKSPDGRSYVLVERVMLMKTKSESKRKYRRMIKQGVPEYCAEQYRKNIKAVLRWLPVNEEHDRIANELFVERFGSRKTRRHGGSSHEHG